MSVSVFYGIVFVLAAFIAGALCGFCLTLKVLGKELLAVINNKEYVSSKNKPEWPNNELARYYSSDEYRAQKHAELKRKPKGRVP